MKAEMIQQKIAVARKMLAACEEVEKAAARNTSAARDVLQKLERDWREEIVAEVQRE